MTTEREIRTILLVDDEAEIREIYTEVLTDLGYKVIAEADGPSALSVIRQGAGIDLVITDLLMPGMDGLEFIRSLRAVLPSVPVIMVTAFSSVESYLQSFALGVFEYVNKPVRIGEFERIVAAALDGSGKYQTFEDGRT